MQAAPVTVMSASVNVGRGISVSVAWGKEVLVGSSVGLEAACVLKFIARAVWKAAEAIALVSRVGAGAGAKMPERALIGMAIPQMVARIPAAIRHPIGSLARFWLNIFPNLYNVDD